MWQAPDRSVPCTAVNNRSGNLFTVNGRRSLIIYRCYAGIVIGLPRRKLHANILERTTNDELLRLR